MTISRNYGEGEYYHIYNRGAHRGNIVHNETDRKRFLFGILYYQSPRQFTNVQRIVEGYSPLSGFPVSEQALDEVLQTRIVDLVCFCLMPNHFHLLVRERTEGGISSYMGRIMNAYTHYINTKYERSGHLFEGRYKAKHIADNNQLLYLSAYIHRNPRELKAWKETYFEYPWSSLQDLTEANRWGGLLEADIIADQFETTPDSNYRDFVETSTAKIFEEEIPGFEQK